MKYLLILVQILTVITGCNNVDDDAKPDCDVGMDGIADYKTVIDPVTELEWLDISETLASSYEETVDQWEDNGFRHATISEIGTFLENLGFGETPDHPKMSIGHVIRGKPSEYAMLMGKQKSIGVTRNYKFAYQVITSGVTKDSYTSVNSDTNGESSNITRFEIADSLKWPEMGKHYQTTVSGNKDLKWVYTLYIVSPIPFNFQQMEVRIRTDTAIEANAGDRYIGHWMVKECE